MRIMLVVPGLLSLPAQALARDASLSRIASRARPVAESDCEAALLDDLPLDTAPAPLAALGAGIDVVSRWAIRADPVGIVVGRDDARLDGYVHDLSDVERTILLALLNAHFADDGLVFHAPRADAWFATSAEPHAIETTPVEHSIGQPLRALLPVGPDGARWRRWLTEVQMLLHEHALALRPDHPVNALWFAGGGSLPEAARIPSVHAVAAAGRNGDLLRGVARMQGDDPAVPLTFEAVVGDSRRATIAVALPRIGSLDAWSRVARDFLTPALDALDRGSLSSVKLIADGEGGAASWHAGRSSWLATLTRPRARFVVPTPITRS